MVYYYFFGAINYMLTTRPYYETHAGELTVRELEQMAVLVHGPIDFKVRLGFRLTANILLMQRSAARH